MIYFVNLLLLAVAMVFLWVNYGTGRAIEAGTSAADPASLRRSQRTRRAFVTSVAGTIVSLLLIVAHIIWTAVLDGGFDASLICLGVAVLLAILAAWAVYTGLVA